MSLLKSYFSNFAREVFEVEISVTSVTIVIVFLVEKILPVELVYNF